MEGKTKTYKNRGELVFETLKQEILDLELKPGQIIGKRIGKTASGTGLCQFGAIFRYTGNAFES